MYVATLFPLDGAGLDQAVWFQDMELSPFQWSKV